MWLVSERFYHNYITKTRKVKWKRPSHVFLEVRKARQARILSRDSCVTGFMTMPSKIPMLKFELFSVSAVTA